MGITGLHILGPDTSMFESTKHSLSLSKRYAVQINRRFGLNSGLGLGSGRAGGWFELDPHAHAHIDIHTVHIR